MTAPKTTVKRRSNSGWLRNKTSAMIIEASPITIVPIPEFKSAKPLFCASKEPERAMHPLEII